jgi:hypothetical protein
MEKKYLIAKFSGFLKEFGFKRSGAIWSKINAENALLVHLRRSQWCEKYYLDIGVCFAKDEQGVFFTKVSKVDLNIAAEHLIPELETTFLDPALDMEMSNDYLLTNLIDFLKEKLPPFLEKMSSIDGLKQLYNQGDLKGAAIVPFAREILGITG